MLQKNRVYQNQNKASVVLIGVSNPPKTFDSDTKLAIFIDEVGSLHTLTVDLFNNRFELTEESPWYRLTES